MARNTKTILQSCSFRYIVWPQVGKRLGSFALMGLQSSVVLNVVGSWQWMLLTRSRMLFWKGKYLKFGNWTEPFTMLRWIISCGEAGKFLQSCSFLFFRSPPSFLLFLVDQYLFPTQKHIKGDLLSKHLLSGGLRALSILNDKRKYFLHNFFLWKRRFCFLSRNWTHAHRTTENIRVWIGLDD